jgi:hypothetical protein
MGTITTDILCIIEIETSIPWSCYRDVVKAISLVMIIIGPLYNIIIIARQCVLFIIMFLMYYNYSLLLIKYIFHILLLKSLKNDYSNVLKYINFVCKTLLLAFL